MSIFIYHNNSRRGLSLIEVLISMFVLLFGLMGVAAIFPVGNHFAALGERADRANVVAESAFADLKARGILNPNFWYWPLVAGGGAASTAPLPFIAREIGRNDVLPGEFNVINNDLTIGPGFALVFDPRGAALGVAEGSNNLHLFPIASLADHVDGASPTSDGMRWPGANWPDKRGPGAAWPLRRLTFQSPNNKNSTLSVMPLEAADAIFSKQDDLAIELPQKGDQPGVQRFTEVATGNSNRALLLNRASVGDYTWFATLVPPNRQAWAALQPADPSYGDYLYDVSIAVMHKREALTPNVTNERMVLGEMLPGNELQIYANLNDGDSEKAIEIAVKDIHDGDWMAVTGVQHPTAKGNATDAVFVLHWYRVLSLENETGVIQGANSTRIGRRLMLDGPDWPVDRADPVVQAIFVPGVVSVVTRPMRLAQ